MKVRLSDFDELRYGTDPFVQDSDGDEVNDAMEVTNGSDPADAADNGDPSNCLSLELVVGDHSASESERYELKVGANVRHVAPQWGKLNTNTYAFVKGKEYPFEVHWLNTALGKETDYDYTAKIGGLSSSGTGPSFIVNDPQGILGEHNESTYDFAAGESGTLCVYRVNIDFDGEEGCERRGSAGEQ